jgi:hypothetical protein|tara:strand:+ start:6467 stop:6733 length:267 start_codon:yes stop_codon:yes gene_type:complete
LPQNKQTNLGIDGFPRPIELEKQINANIHTLFTSPTGNAVLTYLKSITTQSIHGSAVTNDVLRHVEGQRYIVGLIENRMIKHERNKNG